MVERPLRLHSQITRKAIESLRFASGDEAIRSEIHDQFGDALFDDFGSVRDKLEKWLLEWGKPDDNGGDEEVEAGAAKPAVPEKKKKKLLDASTWQRDGRLVETATKLQREVGDGLFEDHNVFRERVNEAVERLGLKLSGAETKILLRAVSWRVETAVPVLAKIHKHGKVAARSDPRAIRTDGARKAVCCGVRARFRTARHRTSAATRTGRHRSLLSGVKCCPTFPTPGLTPTPRRPDTRYPSPAISTSRNRCARSKRSALTFWRCRRRRWGCWTKSSKEPQSERRIER